MREVQSLYVWVPLMHVYVRRVSLSDWNGVQQLIEALPEQARQFNSLEELWQQQNFWMLDYLQLLWSKAYG